MRLLTVLGFALFVAVAAQDAWSQTSGKCKSECARQNDECSDACPEHEAGAKSCLRECGVAYQDCADRCDAQEPPAGPKIR